jgi:hypothetical protein
VIWPIPVPINVRELWRPEYRVMEDVEVFGTEIQVKAFGDAKATAHHEIGLGYGKGTKVIAGEIARRARKRQALWHPNFRIAT